MVLGGKVNPEIVALVEQAGGPGLLGITQAVGVDVVERQAAGMLVHEDEGRAVDDLSHAEPLRDPLRQLRLAGAERADQREQRSGLRSLAQGAADPQRRLGGIAAQPRGGQHVVHDRNRIREHPGSVLGALLAPIGLRRRCDRLQVGQRDRRNSPVGESHEAGIDRDP